MSDYIKNSILNDINRRQLSFGDIDEQQTQYVSLLIDAWRNQYIHVLEVSHYLDDIVLDNLTPEKINDLKQKNEDGYSFWEDRSEESDKGYRDGLHDPDQQDNIHGALVDIKQRLMDCEIDSWGAAIAMAEILYAALPAEDKNFFDCSDQEQSIRDFKRLATQQRNYWKDRDDRHHQVSIREAMKPEPEDGIKKTADACLGAMKNSGFENFMSGNKGQHELFDSALGSIDDKIDEMPQEVQDTLFPGGIDKIWGNWDDSNPICNEMHIAPSGTGLIRIGVLSDGTHDFYGVKVARVTTYSVSLKVADQDDILQASRMIEIALGALQTYNPTRDFSGGGEYGKNYETPRPYIKEEDGVISISDRFSLDDLWIFYYIIEPILESNSQIATAMDMARYAEERGAPLDPDALYLTNHEHDVSDEAHTLKDDANALPIALKDAFSDVAIGRINKGQFLNRLSVLADHSLQGDISDPKGLLTTYDQIMIEDQSSDSKNGQSRELTTYEQAMTDRVYDFIRVLTGNHDDEVELGLSLIQMINRYEPQLKEMERQRQIEKALLDDSRIDKDMERRNEERKYGGDTRRSILLSDSDDFDDISHLSEAFDKLRGYQKRGLETLQYEDGEDYKTTTDVVAGGSSQLVIRNSNVETCLDEMHYLGQTGGDYDEPHRHNYYRSKTKGSMYPRKELPTKLKPFAAKNNDPRKGFNALEFKAL